MWLLYFSGILAIYNFFFLSPKTIFLFLRENQALMLPKYPTFLNCFKCHFPIGRTYFLVTSYISQWSELWFFRMDNSRKKDPSLGCHRGFFLTRVSNRLSIISRKRNCMLLFTHFLFRPSSLSFFPFKVGRPTQISAFSKQRVIKRAVTQRYGGFISLA